MKYPKRLLMNKKGSLLDSAGNILNGIVSILPPQVKFLLFLLMLVLVSFLITVIFNVFGIYCNSGQEPVKLSGNLLQNIDLMGNVPKMEDLGKTALNMDEWGFTQVSGQVTECSFQLPSGMYTMDDGNQIVFTQPTWFYDGSFCTDCTRVAVYTAYGSDYQRYGGFAKKFCLGNVYPKSDDNKGFLQRAWCGGFACEPPKHYFYSSSENIYRCSDNTCFGITLGQKWDETLSTKGASLLYPTNVGERDKTSSGFIGVTCTELSPRLAIFGIDLFTFNIWLFITLIIILFWAWKELT